MAVIELTRVLARPFQRALCPLWGLICPLSLLPNQPCAFRSTIKQPLELLEKVWALNIELSEHLWEILLTVVHIQQVFGTNNYNNYARWEGGS